MDGTECPVEKPVDPHLRSLLWSGKKGYTTLMYEIGVLITTGDIVYVQGSYPGSQNDWGMHWYYNISQYVVSLVV